MAVVLVLGSGGREHALVHALSSRGCPAAGGGGDTGGPDQDKNCTVSKIYVAPGNAGIQLEQSVECVSLDLRDHESVAAFCRERSVALVVVGPEAPLADGLSDALTAAGILVFGPTKKAARLEADKSFAKRFMTSNCIPTPAYDTFKDSKSAKEFIEESEWDGWVVKASGLAAGKGVVVAGTKEKACAAVDELKKLHPEAASTLVIEKRVQGTEVSALCFTDGRLIAMLPPSQDHKTRYSGNKGPNTGGMGAVCPYPLTGPVAAFCREVLQAAVDGMARFGAPFQGVLYAGLMLTEEGLVVLEFNCRFGDPETEAILPLLRGNIFSTMRACALGNLPLAPPLTVARDMHACAVVVVTRDYPLSGQTGLSISGLAAAERNTNTAITVKVYHNSTKRSEDGGLVTGGGRVVTVVVTAPCASTARLEACRRAALVEFEGAEWRDDIGMGVEETQPAGKDVPNDPSPHQRQLPREKEDAATSALTYSASGVDVAAGDAFVEAIKGSAAATHGVGVLGGLGDFAGFYDLRASLVDNPVIVSGADGVGTKLMVAQAAGNHSAVGQDLVAMCLNDVLCHGAQPLFFLDYLATGRLQPRVLQEVVQGVARACKETGMALIGGETAEMPGMYRPGEYDVAGFAVGAVDKLELLPRRHHMREGDYIIGVSASGFHSNGFSLVRRVVDCLGLQYSDPCPFEPARSLGEVLLTPTRLYLSVFNKVRNHILGAAHITGGGLVGNAARMLPPHLAAHLDVSKWDVPAEFLWVAAQGVAASEMASTFNLGLGLLLVVSEELVEMVMEKLKGEDARVVGRLVTIKNSHKDVTTPRVVLEGVEERLQAGVAKFLQTRPGVGLRRRVRTAIFISGRGSNMEAIVSACSAACSPAEVCLVLSNRPDAPGLLWAQRRRVPTVVVDHKNYSRREDFEAAAQEELEKHEVELVCLAGFMRILTEGFVRRWRGRLVNIHPSLLPAFRGKDAQRQALQAGVKISGCTVHFVEAEVDSGAIIAQASVPVAADDTEDSLSERIRRAEHNIFPRAVLEVAAKLQQELHSSSSSSSSST